MKTCKTFFTTWQSRGVGHKTALLLSVLLLCADLFFAQTPANRVVRRIRTWRVSELLAVADTVSVDTLHLNYQDSNPIDRFSIANAYNGNMLSPLESKIYFNRPQTSDFLFADAYSPYIQTVENTNFYNTTVPLSNITYKSGGSSFRWEEEIAFLFTANLGKRFNLGTNIAYTISHGEYQRQQTQHFVPAVFAAYDGRRYKFTATAFTNSLNNYENGGISDTRYITQPAQYDLPTENIPVRMGGNFGFSKYNYRAFYYNHQYCLGFEKEVKITPDSSRFDYIPVTRFIHTFKIDEHKKRYHEPQTNQDSTFYVDTFVPARKETNDSAMLFSVSNTVAFLMEEEFNRLMQFGLTAFVSNQYQRFTLANPDSTHQRVSFMNTKIGGMLSKTRGGIFRYNLLGELGIQGYKAGNFLLKADLGGYFRLWQDSVVLRANGLMRLDAPSYFTEHYNCNHFRWDNDFAPVYRTRMGGSLNIPTRGVSLDLQVENLLNHIYYDRAALPAQYDKNIQILAFGGNINLHIFKWLHWEVQATAQMSSQPDVLPLPALALYSNIYYLSRWFSVLDIQAGANVHYHTAYNAPAFMPATGRFYQQNTTKIGNYPLINAYLNFKLKQARIFVEYWHVNQLIVGDGSYFSMPNYPFNPAIFKWGVSWNFYN